MPIVIPEKLPAHIALMRDGIDVQVEPAGPAPISGRPPRETLHIGLVNLAADKRPVELYFARLLGGTPITVRLSLLAPDCDPAELTPPAHLRDCYQRFSSTSRFGFDGLIVAGQPGDSHDEAMSRACLTSCLDWVREAECHTVYVGAIARAALNRFHGVTSHAAPPIAPASGTQQVHEPGSPLLRGMGDAFALPVRGELRVDPSDLCASEGLELLAGSRPAGAALISDYDQDSLYLVHDLPVTHDADATEPSHAERLLYRNWLAQRRARVRAQANTEFAALRSSHLG